MALKFPIFAPLPPEQLHNQYRSATTEVHFSRWNNANAEKFIRQERTQKEIEDQLRFIKRFNSADKITKVVVPTRNHIASPTPTFKSNGSPSSPSLPSIPGKFSKYSKSTHPAFQQIVRPRKLPNDDVQTQAGIKISDNGVSYVVPEAPFEFQYSYTETPKAKPLKLREPPIAPFGPGTMPRPWTGRKPLAPSKKKLEFDSFKLPPAHKKGVKPVQAPGPFLPGSGPRYVRTREEILGEPLSKEEIDDLVDGCMKSKRQLNMGRDGLTHNMLDNIHALWKRRRVCKIKCKGVCTVDMDNVRKQLEEKTGGKIIRSKGGVIFLFRGRNYNFKTRPVFPLMLWKPVTPLYPRLVKRSPEGLTLDEANEMRKKGRQLAPITKLGKNGVYSDLVKNVREAFEACELVRIDCQGMNGSDYRKIGAKLKDLVPCVLISFESEHILMWRGRDWKSSLPELEVEPQEVKKADSDDAAPITSLSTLSTDGTISDNGSSNEEYLRKEEGEDFQVAVDDSHSHLTTENFDIPSSSGGEGSELLKKSIVSTHHLNNQPESLSTVPSTDETSRDLPGNGRSPSEIMSTPRTEKVLLLLKQAVDGGSAVVLNDSSLDADIVYQKTVALAKSAPPGPAFRHRTKKVATQKFDAEEAGDKKVMTQKFDDEEAGDQEVEEVLTVSKKRKSERSPRKQRKMDLKDDSYLTVVPQGSLRVDELAKLLA